jgi:uncharacterized cupin superfamily protein
MSTRVTNIRTARYTEGESQRGEATWRFLDLSGEHLGVRIEETPPGGTTSHHHYHTQEEEHVLVLAGTATLYLGDVAIELNADDHVWFPAAEEVAHHIENTSSKPFRFLVFGERKTDDVVFYPNGPVLLVKSARGSQQYTYKKRVPDEK